MPGVGAAVDVQATTGGAKRSLALPLLGYASPLVTGLTHAGCVNGTFNNQPQLVQCAREGGGRLTVSGTDFGPSNAVVLIGAFPCLELEHDTIFPSREVTCVLPSGTLSQAAVTFIQSGGSFTQGPLVNYVQCAPGSFQNGSELACVPCLAGTIAGGEGNVLCLGCEGGKYQSLPGKLHVCRVILVARLS